MPLQFGNLFERSVIDRLTDVLVPPFVGENRRAEQPCGRTRRVVAKRQRLDETVPAQHVEESAQQLAHVDLLPVKLKHLFQKDEQYDQTRGKNDPHDRTAVVHQLKEYHLTASPANCVCV